MVKLQDKAQQTRAFNIDRSLNVDTTRKGTGFRKVLRHNQKSSFLGYITIALVGVVGSAIEGLVLFQKFELKILPKSGFRADYPQEQGTNGKWYSEGQFGSAETRAVIERKIHELPEVQSAIKELEALPKPANFGQDAPAAETTGADANPFAPSETVAANPYAD